MKSPRLFAILVWLAACGGDDGQTTPIDAEAEPDAELAPPCVNMTDALCGYTPEAVDPADLSLADQLAVAQAFAPSVIYTGEDIWAVSVDYLLKEGGPLQVAEHDGRLNFSYDVDETTTANVYPDPQPDLTMTDLSGLPTTATGSGRGLVYFLDGPGTNTGLDYNDETWTAGWQAAQGSDDPTAANYPPTTYAHPFWLSKADRLLAIQYFNYYPYDKFTNNHEGDWEHVNIVVRYPSSGAPTLQMAQFSFHGRQLGVAAEDLYTVGDHVVVFVGGDGCLNYVNMCYCGDTSGASYPYPGTWELGYEEEAAGTAGRPGRAVPAEDFTVVLLPRVEDVDLAATPNLSWFGLPFIFGEPTVEANAPATISTENHRAPVGPGPEHDEFDVGIEETDATLELSGPQAFVPPDGWTLTGEPDASVFTTIVNNNCVAP